MIEESCSDNDNIIPKPAVTKIDRIFLFVSNILVLCLILVNVAYMGDVLNININVLMILNVMVGFLAYAAFRFKKKKRV